MSSLPGFSLLPLLMGIEVHGVHFPQFPHVTIMAGSLKIVITSVVIFLCILALSEVMHILGNYISKRQWSCPPSQLQSEF